tara:strand:+ start:827 stop:1894 length:1068 start_codon:yes stop_codon:yes gene_type:complete
MIDSIIVGYGLAGFHYAWELKKHKKEFIIISDPDKGASRSAAGICNPTILKRYTMAWNGINFLDFAMERYKSIQSKLNAKFFEELPIHRHFYEVSEQNEWLVASQHEVLGTFLNPQIQKSLNNSTKHYLGYGIVENLGKLNINALLSNFKHSQYFDRFHDESFNYNMLKISKEKIVYKNIEAKNIVFCEGFGLKENPWFNYLPLVGSKGEYLIIRAPKLSTKKIIKCGVFISPIVKEFFWVGASFSHNDKTDIPTADGRAWLIKKLDLILNIPYKIITHAAAVRPTVIDRRPLLGVHPTYSNLYLFNGLGTRGVLMAPLLSNWLLEFIEERKQIPDEVSVDRFESYFSSTIIKYV